ncbi:MAG: hypothetical protein NXI15_04235 [Gammaproteobacteria bacterium]|nr:hypothetical protein [Gammaproteobacteria bacterium]
MHHMTILLLAFLPFYSLANPDFDHIEIGQGIDRKTADEIIETLVRGIVISSDGRLAQGGIPPIPLQNIRAITRYEGVYYLTTAAEDDDDKSACGKGISIHEGFDVRKAERFWYAQEFVLCI